MELSASHQEFGDDVLYSNTYYPLTDTQLETLIRTNVIKIRFDTSDKFLDIFNCAMRLSNNLNKAKQEITKILEKNIYKNFDKIEREYGDDKSDDLYNVH